jgi:hypothetical protein
MKYRILLIALSAAAFSSCSSVYKSGQTPDDVYYSPARPIEEERKQEREQVYNRPAEDRQIRMAIYDRRWRDFDDDYNCHYDPYRYGYTYGYYYNPYYYPSPVYISNIKINNPKNTTIRTTNLGSYQSSNMVVVNPKTGTTQWIRTGGQYNNSNRNNTRRVLVPTSVNNNSYERSNTNDNRTYSPSNNSSGSSSSGSSNSSGTPVSRPVRGGK